jgi:hypothetical protein
MTHAIFTIALLAATALSGFSPAFAGQVPYSAAAPDIPISSHDRVYTGDQFSNTVSVVDPETNTEDADRHATRAGHDDILAQWEIRLCLFII